MTPDDLSEQKPEFQAGYEAAKTYDTPSCNPYPQHTIEWGWWNAGFFKQKQESGVSVSDRLTMLGQFLADPEQPKTSPQDSNELQ